MSSRSKIVWWLEVDAAEDEEEEHVYMARGWLDETDALRWTLAKALTTEGTHNGWRSANEAVDAVEFSWGEDDDGKKVTIARVPLET